MNRHGTLPHRVRDKAVAGFTLIELMITLLVFAAVVVALGAILLGASHSKERTAQNLEATQTARATLDGIAKDIRSAGYGADEDNATPQPPIAYVDSMQIILSENQNPYPDTSSARRGTPQAYNPGAGPNPRPLVGTQWTPPGKYATGAELIRYTLDLNDDGVVDANDVATAAGADAGATPNPNDYVLVRQVYGDSTGGVANNNGGVQERVALVLRPGGTVPPLFTVYLRGQSTPWDWSNGPVPANKLQQIDRVVVQVTASSSKPDSRGQYPVTSLRTEVNSMRNSPNSGVPTYTVSGYVFNDLNGNHAMDLPTEPGVLGASVQLGPTMLVYTNSAGFFAFRAPPGHYTLRHTPPPGYGAEVNPDTFVVNVTSANVGGYQFPDTAMSGGYVTLTVFNDLNSNGVEDAGELGLPGVRVTLGSTSAYTDGGGMVTLFAATGAWSAAATVPDTMTATSPNPVTGTMVNGGTASVSIGLVRSPNGTVTGTVFKDLNKNGNQDNGEVGIPNVWVGVTNDGGVTVLGFAYTDNNGLFTINVPANDPPRTKPYTVYCVPPANLFPTTSTAAGGVFVRAGQTTGSFSFGMANYQVITVNANRVLSLAARDLMENDWKGNQTAKAHGDVDLVLGADSFGTDQISVWFNQYNSSPLFNPSPDYARAAPQSVLCMALDTLDANVAPFARPDLVTGTKYTTNGNFFVWFTQNSSGNEGYFPGTFSSGQNYATSDNGDVQAVQTLDCVGGPKPDIIVGTKSATANQGQIEVWANDDAATPSFSRAETYTTFGLGTLIGEVTAMQLADIDGDGLPDLVVAAKTGTYSGQLLFFKNMGKLVIGNHFLYQSSVIFSARIPMAIGIDDVDGDGAPDVFVGTQDGTSTGSIIYLHNNGLWDFSRAKTINAPGIVISMGVGDMGGNVNIPDLVVGWRASTSTFAGGVQIYYLDVLGLPSNGSDPSGGTILNMVPAVVMANFNYGTYPTGAPSPYLTDLAVGVKASSTTGSLVIFIR